MTLSARNGFYQNIYFYLDTALRTKHTKESQGGTVTRIYICGVQYIYGYIYIDQRALNINYIVASTWTWCSDWHRKNQINCLSFALLRFILNVYATPIDMHYYIVALSSISKIITKRNVPVS